MPSFNREILALAAGKIVILHGAFEAVAGLTEDELFGLVATDPNMMENFGDMVDPHRTIRGPGVGRPSTY